MDDFALRAENISKLYRIGRKKPTYGRISEAIWDTLTIPIRSLKMGRIEAAPPEELLWALRNVSFEIRKGEVVGIIGRNGAGKSTLLKILSRVTSPTEGHAVVYGRIGSLLEVGTGFHPELTGRENAYLNGAILGMSRREIDKKFDEIVDFAGIDKFIDTPVKHYSSGMYMRLAFAVAAHLEPEILIVDEVLAVGDAKFQEKSIGKMREVAGRGRTVLIVSHNMPIVQRFCRSAIVLDAGRIIYSGQTEEAISVYLGNTLQLIQNTDLKDRQDRMGNNSLRLTRVNIFDSAGQPLERISTGQDIKVRIYYESTVSYQKASVLISFNIYNPEGVLLTNLNSRDVSRLDMSIGRSGFFECSWPSFNLRTGVYTCTLFCQVNGVIVDWIQSAFEIAVDDGDFFGSGVLSHRDQGDILVHYDWRSAILEQ